MEDYSLVLRGEVYRWSLGITKKNSHEYIIVISNIKIESKYWSNGDFWKPACYFITNRYFYRHGIGPDNSHYIEFPGYHNATVKFDELYPDFELMSNCYDSYRKCLRALKKQIGCKCPIGIKCAKKSIWDTHMIIYVDIW